MKVSKIISEMSSDKITPVKGEPKPIKLPVLVSMEDLFMMSQPPPPPKTPSPTMKIKKEPGTASQNSLFGITP